MRPARLILVLGLLMAVPASGFSQLLPRRRAETGNAVLEKIFAEFASRVIADVAKKGVWEWFAEHGQIVSLDASLQICVELQGDPAMKKRIDDDKDPNSPAALKRELMTRGSARIFLAETAKLAEKLKSEKFSPPVLQRIYLEVEVDGVKPPAEGAARSDQWTARPYSASEAAAGQDASKPPGNGRTVMCYSINRPRDPKNRNPVTIHCSFVFTAQRDGKEVEKVLFLDLYLKQLKLVDGANPWKVKDVVIQ